MKRGLLAGLVLLLFAIQAHAVDVEILCRKSSYSPNAFTVKKGEKVRVILKSADVPHGFAIDELNVATEVSPGPPTVVEFTPDRAGKFEFYCVVRCGKDHLKMRGVMTVTE